MRPGLRRMAIARSALRAMAFLGAGLLAVTCWAPGARSETPSGAPLGAQQIKLTKESQLWVEGDSTLHKYRLDAKDLQAVFGVTGSAGVVNAAALQTLIEHGGITALEVRVPVGRLVSGDDGLDDNLRGALKADQHPELRFQMDSYQSSPGADSATLLLRIKGRLQISGVEKPVEIDAIAARGTTALRVMGSKKLLMTDYGIKPPTFMLGMMSVSDPITVHFDLRLEPGP